MGAGMCAVLGCLGEGAVILRCSILRCCAGAVTHHHYQQLQVALTKGVAHQCDGYATCAGRGGTAEQGWWCGKSM